MALALIFSPLFFLYHLAYGRNNIMMVIYYLIGIIQNVIFFKVQQGVRFKDSCTHLSDTSVV